MASWRDEYIQSLHDRDVREKASYQRLDAEFVSAYTALLDRTAFLEASYAAQTSSSTTHTPSTETKPQPRGSPAPPATNDSSTAQIRKDLAEALRANTHLQTRIKAAESELSKLKVKSRAEGKQVEELGREKAWLERRLRDREEEGRGKGKLLDDVHDEIISLNLQLNMSEQKVKDLKAENKELIDRWMASKRRDAEEMNREFERR